MVEIPPSLLERLKVRQTVLVAGLRCSELAGAPAWDELAPRLAAWLAREARDGERPSAEAPEADAQKAEVGARVAELSGLLAAGRRVAAFALLGARVPRDALVEVLKEAYPMRASAPALVARVARIPWRGLVTTGFDGLWAAPAASAGEAATDATDEGDVTRDDAAADAASEVVGLALSAADAPALEHAGRFVLDLCGTTAAPETLALGAADHRARLGPTGVVAALGALARRRSFVLVGFAPGDPDLALVARALEGGGPHFLFADVAGLEADVLAAELGVTVVGCGAGRGGLEEALGALADAWSTVASEARPAADDVAAWLEIWRREPGDEEARAALARAEDALRAEERWDDVIEILLARVELATDVGAEVATLREVARLYADELGAPDRAFAALEAAFRHDPSAEAVRVEVERAAGQAHLWGELAADYAEIITEVAAGPGGAAAAVPHRLALARLYADELDQLGDAIAEHEAVLAVDANNEPAARALVELLTSEERWADLAVALARAAERGGERGPGRAVELRLQLADVQAARLGDVGAAIATYERVLADDPESPESSEARDALERLLRRAERWADLARVLDGKARRAGDPALASRLRRERADLLAERLGDPDGSIRELEALLADDPDNRAVLGAIEKLYERQGRAVDSLRTLERLAELAESDAERLSLLRRLAAGWEAWRGVERRAGADSGATATGLDRAADALEQVLQLAPDDVDAFAALARVYRQARRFLALAEAITRRRQVSSDRAERRALAAELGRVYEEELQDPARAAEAYGEAETLGDEGETTLGALARLRASAGRWVEAADTFERVARAAREPAARVAALVRAAEIARDELGDRATAEARYARALEIEPGDAGALVALAALYRAHGELLRAAKLMREAEAHTSNRIEKARLLYELGVLYQDELDDAAQAADVLARVLDVDPEHVPAAERLVTLYERAERWAALEPVLEMLARKVDRADPAVAARAHARLGETARRLGNLDKAARAFETARELAPDALEVLRGFGVVCEERREWGEAVALYVAAAAQAAALPLAERVDLYLRLARCEGEAGAREAALASYGKALGLDPDNRRATEAVAALHAAEGDFAALVADKRALLALAGDDEARARLWDEIGDLLHDKLGDDDGALEAYRAALALAPARRGTLHKALELTTATRRWSEAAETLGRLAELETASAVRAKYLYAEAVIRRDELDDPASAVALLNRALDDAPDLTKAFDAVERVLSDVGAWRELARNYRRMIKRLPAEGFTDLRLRLWSGLGEVSLTQLEDTEMAATALEVAVTLDPDNVQRHEQLADVYVGAGASHHDKAIAEHQWLVAKNPDRLGSYLALAKLYGEIGAYDKLWCVAATLSFLRKADASLQAFYDTHRPQTFRAAKRPFNEEVWLRVAHPDEDRFIDAIFMLLGQFVAAGAAQQHQALGLRRKERVDVMTDQRVPTRILRYVAETLELAAPDLFFKESEPQSLALLNLQERGVLTPALVIGKGIEQRGSEVEVVFEMGKRMAFLRPERFVRSAVPSAAALDVTLRAALALGGAPVGSGPHNGEVDALTSELRRLVPKPVTDQVAAVGRKLVTERGEVIDVQTWMGAVDLTAARVGFALTNDLASAARVISTEPPAASAVSPTRRLQDLLAYSVSEDYFAVRKVLGLEVM
jgi:golgin subfamily B member 1